MGSAALRHAHPSLAEAVLYAHGPANTNTSITTLPAVLQTLHCACAGCYRGNVTRTGSSLRATACLANRRSTRKCDYFLLVLGNGDCASTWPLLSTGEM